MTNTSRPVMVLTDLYDTTADLVIAELHGRGIPVVRLDPGGFPSTVVVSAEIGGGLAAWDGLVATPTRTADLSGVRSLWYRRPSGFNFDHLDPQTRAYATTHARYGLGGVLASLPDCRYVNHPFRAGDAEFKPVQLATAINTGFAVPRTLISSDPQSARDFAKEHGPVLFKPLATPNYFDADGVSLTVGVSPLGPDDIDDSVAGTAHLFQRQVDKVADIRTTVIGTDVFSVRIESGLLDWRQDYAALSYGVVPTPFEVGNAIVRYMAALRLSFGAFDFALGTDGTWWFLECNPSGQFLWLEPETGLPLTATMANFLGRGDTL